MAITLPALAALPLLYFAFQRRWTWIALVVAAGHFMVVVESGAAPFVAAIDPNYDGYRIGLISAERGLVAAAIAAAVLLASALAACVAVRNRPGPVMLIVAATSAFHLLNLGLPFAQEADYDPGKLGTQALFLVPFSLGAVWAIQRTFGTE